MSSLRLPSAFALIKAMRHFRPSGFIACLLLLSFRYTPATATETTSHVRPQDQRLAAMIEDGARRSPSFRSLLDALDVATVLVYIEEVGLPTRLHGRLTFLGRGERWRYVRVEIESQQPDVESIGALAHELQHALEIGKSADAVDAASVQKLYDSIGYPTDSDRTKYETNGAREMGLRVRQEMLSDPATF